ncbi:MAG TPA: ribosome maturation factor RimP [Trebonia sp.]|jgi:ribosome maturation factor RimP|nr:ribosome maturation factor RimP [Trebonia sp.]
MPGGTRPAAGPVDDKRLAGLIRPVVTAAGMDLESVRASVAGRRRLLRIIVDSDSGVSLDDAAQVSRDISAALDATDVMGETAYTLEVSSPGVDRPLTEPRHWRRAAGRLVKVKVASEGSLQGRVRQADDAGVTFDMDGARREFAYDVLGPGTVQVEFGHLPEELADDEYPDDGVPDDAFGDEAELGAGGDGH